ncbi:MAG: DUF222 domain-containing protein [Acidimicrobiia bacterium]|nr:DUF222 domain-containing protein [Acidimicrobiia bacterium]
MASFDRDSDPTDEVDPTPTGSDAPGGAGDGAGGGDGAGTAGAPGAGRAGDGAAGGSGSGLAGVVADLVASVDGLVGACDTAELAATPGSVIGDAAVTVGTELSRLGWARQALVGAWDLSGDWSTGGARNVAGEYRQRTGCTTNESRRVARMARRLRDMPATSAAWQAGDISDEAVDALCRLRNSRTAELFERDEEVLVRSAQALDGDDFARVANHWESCADDELADDHTTSRDERDDERRSVGWTCDRHGNAQIIARLEAVGGATVIAELERLERQLFEADWAEARQIHGEDTTSAHLKRTNNQRRADALKLMAERSAAAAPNAANAPLVSVLIDLTSFTRAVDLHHQRHNNSPDNATADSGGPGTPNSATVTNTDTTDYSDTDGAGPRTPNSDTDTNPTSGTATGAPHAATTPSGETGPSGQTSQTGPSGTTGPTSETSLTGPTSETSETSPTSETSETSETGPSREAGPTSEAGTATDDDRRRSEWARRIAELANGTPLTISQLARLLDNADIERCVIAPNSRIIDIGHRTRFFTGATRRAVEIRDRWCTHPTCNEPAHRCHVDHITPWCHGGPTTQDNGRLLCGPHNRARTDHPTRPERPPPQPPP